MPGFCPYTIAPSRGLGTPWDLLPTHRDTPDCPTPRFQLLVIKSPAEPHQDPDPHPCCPNGLLPCLLTFLSFFAQNNISFASSLPSA